MKTEEFNARLDQIIEQIHQLAQEACPDATMFSVSWYSFKVPTVSDTDVSIYMPNGAHWRKTDAYGVHRWERSEYDE